jgi:hypothetical protein
MYVEYEKTPAYTEYRGGPLACMAHSLTGYVILHHDESTPHFATLLPGEHSALF